MRPGAKGFLKVMVALVLLSLVFVVFTTWTEFGTIGADDPISHFLSDMPKMGVAMFALVIGVLGSSVFWVGVVFLVHAHWPAKGRWKEQDDAIERFGDPATGTMDELARFALALWRIHTGGKS